MGVFLSGHFLFGLGVANKRLILITTLSGGKKERKKKERKRVRKKITCVTITTVLF